MGVLDEICVRGIDDEISTVYEYLMDRPDFAHTLFRTVYHSVAYALHPYGQSLKDIRKEKKSVIGCQWGDLFVNELDINRGNKLDCSVDGIEWDLKMTVSDPPCWEIPQECVNHICFLVQYTEGVARDRIFAGLIRATESNLRKKGNRDGKRSISAEGRSNIAEVLNVWITPQSKKLVDYLTKTPAFVVSKEKAA